MVEARNGAGPIKSYPRPGSRLKMQNGSKGSGLQNKTFHCEICDVHVNSEIQLKQVMYSELVYTGIWGHPLTVFVSSCIDRFSQYSFKLPSFIECKKFATCKCKVEEKASVQYLGVHYYCLSGSMRGVRGMAQQSYGTCPARASEGGVKPLLQEPKIWSGRWTL